MILGLDTATEWVYLTLVGDGRCCVRCAQSSRGKTASAILLPLADELLAEAGAKRTDVSGVAVCVGPGGFTSLRVGIATAEGLGVAGLPTWGFSAFELRARSIANRVQDGIVYLLLDGQRGEAFVQPWDVDNIQPHGAAARIPLTEVASTIGGHEWWTPERFRPSVAPHLTLPPTALEDEPSATLDALAELCRICPSRPPEAPLMPFYLRETDAELNFPAQSAHLKDEHRRGSAR
jgi:tRNA threonylcarbamoyladenosine biosynthesis protein TsaB